MSFRALYRAHSLCPHCPWTYYPLRACRVSNTPVRKPQRDNIYSTDQCSRSFASTTSRSLPRKRPDRTREVSLRQSSPIGSNERQPQSAGRREEPDALEEFEKSMSKPKALRRPRTPRALPVFEHDAFSPQSRVAASARPAMPKEEQEETKKEEQQDQSIFQSRIIPVSSEEIKPVYDETSTMPWFLQHQEAQRTDATSLVSSPLLERQTIPVLPPNPPPLLAYLLEHISIQLGLDSLSLIDLRRLDPPAALGSNLLMIVGSCRSEKHLHVSADRLCRWLRTEHKLRPSADGLLGRNELKLKMKRKNRRAKVLASAGLQGWGNQGGLNPVKDEGIPDDGIRTGWVCVQVGRVQPGEAPQEALPRDDPGGTSDSPSTIQHDQPFIGFSEDSNEVTVVVQMFTEEKRAETDLESLWNTALERNLRKQQHRQDLESLIEPLSMDESKDAPDNVDPWSSRFDALKTKFDGEKASTDRLRRAGLVSRPGGGVKPRVARL